VGEGSPQQHFPAPLPPPHSHTNTSTSVHTHTLPPHAHTHAFHAHIHVHIHTCARPISPSMSAAFSHLVLVVLMHGLALSSWEGIPTCESTRLAVPLSVAATIGDGVTESALHIYAVHIHGFNHIRTVNIQKVSALNTQTSSLSLVPR
jgi:hypothetical protein